MTDEINDYVSSYGLVFIPKYSAPGQLFGKIVHYEITDLSGNLLYDDFTLTSSFDQYIYLDNYTLSDIENYVSNNYNIGVDYTITNSDNAYYINTNYGNLQLYILPTYTSEVMNTISNIKFGIDAVTNKMNSPFYLNYTVNYNNQNYNCEIYITFLNNDIVRINLLKVNSTTINYTKDFAINYSTISKEAGYYYTNAYNTILKEYTKEQSQRILDGTIINTMNTSLYNNEVKMNAITFNDFYYVLVNGDYIPTIKNIDVNQKTLNIYLYDASEENIKAYLLEKFDLEASEYTLNGTSSITLNNTCSLTHKLRRSYGSTINIHILTAEEVLKYLPDSFEVNVSDEYNSQYYSIRTNNINYDFDRFTFMTDVYILNNKLYYSIGGAQCSKDINVIYQFTNTKNLSSIMEDVSERYSIKTKKLNDIVNLNKTTLLSDINNYVSEYNIKLVETGGSTTSYEKTTWYNVYTLDDILIYNSFKLSLVFDNELYIDDPDITKVEQYISDNYDLDGLSFNVSYTTYYSLSVTGVSGSATLKIYASNTISNLDNVANKIKFASTFFDDFNSAYFNYDGYSIFVNKKNNFTVTKLNDENMTTGKSKEYVANVLELDDEVLEELKQLLNEFNPNITYSSLSKPINEVLAEFNSNYDYLKAVAYNYTYGAYDPPVIMYYVMYNDVFVKVIEGTATNVYELYLENSTEETIKTYINTNFELTNDEFILSYIDSDGDSINDIWFVNFNDNSLIYNDKFAYIKIISSEEILIKNLPDIFNVKVSNKYYSNIQNISIFTDYIDYDFSDFTFLSNIYIYNNKLYYKMNNQIYFKDITVVYNDAEIDNLENILENISNLYSLNTTNFEEISNINFQTLLNNINAFGAEYNIKFVQVSYSDDLFIKSTQYNVETLDGVLLTTQFYITSKVSDTFFMDNPTLDKILEYVSSNYDFGENLYSIKGNGNDYYLTFNDNDYYVLYLGVYPTTLIEELNYVASNIYISDEFLNGNYFDFNYIYTYNNVEKTYYISLDKNKFSIGLLDNNYEKSFNYNVKNLNEDAKAKLMNFVNNFEKNQYYDPFNIDKDTYLNRLSNDYKIEFYNIESTLPCDSNGYFIIYDLDGTFLYSIKGSLAPKELTQNISYLDLSEINLLNLSYELLNYIYTDDMNLRVVEIYNNFYIKRPYKNSYTYQKINLISNKEVAKRIDAIPDSIDGLLTENYFNKLLNSDLTIQNKHLDYDLDSLGVQVKYENGEFNLYDSNNELIKKITLNFYEFNGNVIQNVQNDVDLAFTLNSRNIANCYNIKNSLTTYIDEILNKYNLYLKILNSDEFDLNETSILFSGIYGYVDSNGHFISTLNYTFSIDNNVYVTNEDNTYDKIKEFIEDYYVFDDYIWELKYEDSEYLLQSKKTSMTNFYNISLNIVISSVEINNIETELYVGESIILDTIYSPNSLNLTIGNEDSNTTIDENIITGKNIGTSTVFAKLFNNVIDKITLTIKNVINEFDVNIVNIFNNTLIKTKNFITNINTITSGINLSFKLYNSNNELANRENIVTGDKLVFIKNNKEFYNIKLILPGDVNCYGNISPLDYVMVKNHIMDRGKVYGDNGLAADVNDDNEITPLDYVIIKNYIMNKEV